MKGNNVLQKGAFKKRPGLLGLWIMRAWEEKELVHIGVTVFAIGLAVGLGLGLALGKESQ